MTPQRHAERLARARCALEGLSVGDAFGQHMLVPAPILSWMVKTRKLPSPPWYYTDETSMALALYDTLRVHAGIDQDRLARALADHYERARGYTLAMRSLFPALRQGASWRKLAPTLFGQQGSYGSEAAARVASVGAYFADDLDAAADHARRSAEITNTHPEASAGAIAVACAAALAWQQRAAGTPPPTRDTMLHHVLPCVPSSKVREGIERALDLPPDAPSDMAVAVLGNGSRTTAQDTVPFALWAAAGHMASFEEALWLTVSGMGDLDTTCAIVGGIVVMYTGCDGIPAHWRANREALPDWPFGLSL